MAAYEATASREGHWWIIRVHGIENAVTQARRVRDINEMAAGVVQAILDLHDPPEVKVTIELPEAVAEEWAEASELQRRADEGERRAANLRRHAVRRLLDEGWSQFDAGAALGISHQRVQQLARAGEIAD